MKIMAKIVGTAVAAGMLAGMAVWAEENDQDETVVSFDKVPAAAQTTLAKEAGGAKIAEVEMEKEDGAVTYEAKVMVDGKKYEIKVADNGTLISKELKPKKDQHEQGGHGDHDED